MQSLYMKPQEFFLIAYPEKVGDTAVQFRNGLQLVETAMETI